MRRTIRTRAVAWTAVPLLLLAGCATAPASQSGDASLGGTDRTASERTAEHVLQVSSVHEATGMTLLEGPTFGDDGRLYLVDVTAPPGGPKVMAVDLDTEEVSTVYTDDKGAYTSAQFSPADGRLYLTDYANGRILSVTPGGEDPRTVAAGRIKGTAMHPDDLAFDDAGNMFVTDSAYTTYPDAEPSGRVLRVDHRTGKVTVLADRQPNPNGISFDLDDGALWVSQLDANRIDRLTLNDDRTSVTAGHTGMHVDNGTAQTDSNAVDAAGNVYQAVHGVPRILVHAPDGEHLATITVPAADGDLDSATNLAIRPGTTDAYATVSGPDGGHVYRFDALAEGVRQSNGG
ncbi:SMP-30/gluconolactonase/LRE family protein [Isoptericola sp. NPDC019693]|uniref:SMP-30/gluconolactonase/LRE family protein n=1 Tax=Isoptericola sp. NPDC019693 TaxID=3364009 RepID=UPI003797300D